MPCRFVCRTPALLCLSVGLAFATAPGPTWAQEGDRPVDQATKRLEQGLAAEEPGTTAKIVGGITAPAGKFPFQTALIVSRTPEGSEHLGQFCGGSLIAPEGVLTPAHCGPGTEPGEVDIYVGSSVLPSGGPSSGAAGGVRSAVDEIVVHE